MSMIEFNLSLTPAEATALAVVISHFDLPPDAITEMTGLSPDAFEALRHKVVDLRNTIRAAGL